MTIKQEDLVRLANNPVRGINLVVNEIERNWFDKRVELNSKTHPFILATDLILGTTHELLNRVDDGISKMFPVHARDITDLSKHMGEQERIGMFATPSETTLQFAIEENTFLSIAQEETQVIGKSAFTYKTLLLPKDSEIDLPGYTFALVNGVRIRYSDNAGYQVVYDEQTNNSFFPIENNLLKRQSVLLNGKNYLLVDIPVKQLKCIVLENITSNESSGCSGNIEYVDYLYGVKAYLVRGNQLTELKVTYDQDVFDPQVPTLALDIDTTNKRIKYEIPDVYISNRLGLGTVRIYTYVTKGELNKDLSDVEPSAIQPNYQDYRFGSGTLGKYSSKLKSSGGMAWRALGFCSGGGNALDFEVIKSNFINGRNIRHIPITDKNLVGTVEGLGYSSVKTIDFVTGRSYGITKELPIQDNKDFLSPMSCYIGSHLTSVADLVNSGVVIDNDKRVTIPHNVLFDITTPTSKLVNSYNKNRFEGMTNEEIVDLINLNTYVYTPFYYVLDTTNNQAEIRTYHLDQPKVMYQNFKSGNSTLGVEIGVGSINLEHKDWGYLITLVTDSGKGYKDLDNDQLGVQLIINPVDSNSPATLKGELIGLTEDRERVYTFKLETRFDIDSNNVLFLNNMFQFGDVQDTTGVGLELDLGLIFTMGGDKSNTDTDIDKKIEQNLFDIPMIGIIETSYSAVLGKELDKIYSRVRPLVGEGQYKRHQFDVPATYEETVFERDEFGELVISDNELVIKHKKGDVIVTDLGQTVFEHKAGDYIIEDGELVTLAPRELKYHWDFIGFDAAYFFSMDEYDIEFAQQTKDFFVNVIDKDMSYFKNLSLDRTSFVYQPKNKLGYQMSIVNNNYQSYVKQDLSFDVIYYLTKTGNRNQNLKESLKRTTAEIINKVLFNAQTVSSDELTKQLGDDLPSDVVSVKVGSIAGDPSIDVISVVDELSGFCVKKELNSGGDGLLTIKEAINVSFLPHGSR